MMSFEKNNWSWQLEQWYKKINEWLELQFSQMNYSIPQTDFFSWLDSDWLKNILYVAFYIASVIWVSWLVLRVLPKLIAKIYSKMNQASQSKGKAPPKNISLQEWLEKAQDFQQQENYYEACICLYMAMLEKLDKLGIVTQQSSRTDGEYLKLIQNQDYYRQYQVLFETHQWLCFANGKAEADVFQLCLQAYQELDRVKVKG